MIGIGKWAGSVNTMIFKGNVIIEILDNNGEYGFNIEIVDAKMDIPDFKFYDVVEDGNTLSAKGEVSLLPGKVIDASLTFEGDTMNGFLKIPYVGKIKIKDAKKVS